MSKNTSLLLIFLIGMLSYTPTLFISFFSDEIAFVKRNELKSFTELTEVFNKKNFDRDYYRPVGNLISGIITSVAGYNYSAQRFFNILLHLISSALVYLLALKLFPSINKLIPLYAAGFFMVFPLHDLSVIWLTDLFDRAMLIFYLLALLAWLNEKQIFAIVFFLFSLLAKEMALSFPIVIFLLAFLYNKNSFLKSVVKALPYAAVILAYILFRIVILENNFIASDQTHPFIGIIAIVKNLAIFGGLLIFPFFTYELIPFVKANLTWILAGGFTAMLPLYIMIKKIKPDLKTVLLLLGFTFVTILPASRLVMKWYLYLPSVGYLIFISWFVFTSLSYKKAVLIASLLFGIYLSGSVYTQLKWVNLTTGSDKMFEEFSKKYGHEIAGMQKLNFLTIPAKIAGYGVNHLNFGEHLRYKTGFTGEVEILSRSYLTDWNDKIDYFYKDDGVTLVHNSVNYFILYGYENFYNFSDTDLRKGKLFRLHHKVNNENSNYFSYSEGKFFRLQNETK